MGLLAGIFGAKEFRYFLFKFSGQVRSMNPKLNFWVLEDYRPVRDRSIVSLDFLQKWTPTNFVFVHRFPAFSTITFIGVC